MRRQICSLILTAIFIQIPVVLDGQTLNSDGSKRQMVLQQLEDILDDANKVDGTAAVKVRARAAAVLWSESADRARALFLALWGSIEQHKEDKSFDREEARLAVLRNLYPKDQKLANQLLQQLRSKADDSNQLSLDKIKGTNEETKRTARLALQMVDVDPKLAAQLAQQSLSQNTAPMAIMVLSRLRESDPLFADSVAVNVLENFKHQPSPIAMTGLMAILAYIFPLPPNPPSSEDVERSSEGLRTEFMSVGYPILKASLVAQDNPQGDSLSPESIQFLTVSKVMVAVSLAAMASNDAPGLVNELNQISQRLLQGLPPGVVQAAAFQAATIRRTHTPNANKQPDEIFEGGNAILVAIAKGQFDDAQTLIDKLKDERQKKAYVLTLLKAQFKIYLARQDVDAATKTARKVEDSPTRIQMYADIAKVANQKQEFALSSDLVSEARKTEPSPNRGLVHIRALFSLATETKSFSASEALVVLQEAVRQINVLTRAEMASNNGEARQSASPSNSDLLIDSPELMKSFATLGRDNFDETVGIAAQLNGKALQAIARLAAIEMQLKLSTPGAKSKPRTKPA